MDDTQQMASLNPTLNASLSFVLRRPSWWLSVLRRLSLEAIRCEGHPIYEDLRFQATQTSGACLRLRESRYFASAASLPAAMFSDLITGALVANLRGVFRL